MNRTFEKIKKKEKLLNFFISTIFFLVCFVVMMTILSFVSSI